MTEMRGFHRIPAFFLRFRVLPLSNFPFLSTDRKKKHRRFKGARETSMKWTGRCRK